jgi:NADPH:quinone reductase-like Zn-dependent oxidoreductase
VLIKVHATSVTAGDCNARGFVFIPPGFGFISRLVFGLRKPKQPILGVELSGEIVEVGKDVRLFKKGDQVFGTVKSTARMPNIPAWRKMPRWSRNQRI